ncbi:MAG: hypothetical protein EGQ88_00805 [Prevotellamassilia timonensis]|nr:hypothetical protein [Prevotellamassilia timonensis]
MPPCSRSKRLTRPEVEADIGPSITNTPRPLHDHKLLATTLPVACSATAHWSANSSKSSIHSATYEPPRVGTPLSLNALRNKGSTAVVVRRLLRVR